MTELFSVAIISPSRAREEGEDEERGEEFSLRFPRDGSNFRLQEMRGKRRREAEEKKENVGERERKPKKGRRETPLAREKFSLRERGALETEEREGKERGIISEKERKRGRLFLPPLLATEFLPRERESEGKREKQRGRLFLPPLLAMEFLSQGRERGEESEMEEEGAKKRWRERGRERRPQKT